MNILQFIISTHCFHLDVPIRVTGTMVVGTRSVLPAGTKSVMLVGTRRLSTLEIPEGHFVEIKFLQQI